MKPISTALKQLLFAIFVVTLCACGGGGGKNGAVADPTPKNSENGQEPEDSQEAEWANGVGNTGYIYHADWKYIYRHDVATGERTRYITTYFSDSESASASDDGSLFAVIDDDYNYLAMYRRDSTRLLDLSTGGTDTTFVPPVSISPDKKYFMVRRWQKYKADGINLLEIYDLEGVRTDYVDHNVDAWDWLSENEIIVAYDGTIYRWAVQDGVFIGYPDPVISTGYGIWDLSVSPDKTKIAYIRGGETAHIVDLVGGGDKQIAGMITESPTDKWIKNLVSVRWSPNGKSILVGGDGIRLMWQFKNCTYMSIFPIDSDTVLDTGDYNYWLVHSKEDGYYYTCLENLHSVEWTQN